MKQNIQIRMTLRQVQVVRALWADEASPRSPICSPDTHSCLSLVSSSRADGGGEGTCVCRVSPYDQPYQLDQDLLSQ